VPAPSRSSRYSRFLGLAVAIVVGLCVLGFFPTRRLAGAGAIGSMIAGCAVSLLSAAVAGWFLTAVEAPTPQARMQRSLLAMFVRLAVVIVVGAAAALSGAFSSSPLLFWMAMTYVALLPLEVKLAIAPE
jgi:hypothetical protein